jgi:hypothetical protein
MSAKTLKRCKSAGIDEIRAELIQTELKITFWHPLIPSIWRNVGENQWKVKHGITTCAATLHTFPVDYAECNSECKPCVNVTEGRADWMTCRGDQPKATYNWVKWYVFVILTLTVIRSDCFVLNLAHFCSSCWHSPAIKMACWDRTVFRLCAQKYVLRPFSYSFTVTLYQ